MRVASQVLGAHARVGDTQITLSETPVGWRVGDEIVIANTGFSDAVRTGRSERRTISQIAGNVIT
jgi:hypothetical protein